MQTVFGETHFSITSKGLFDRMVAKELTLQEFMHECAYWALREDFAELRFHSFPTPPDTQAFAEFDILPPERKTKVNPDFFRKNYEIIEYYQQCNSIHWRNKGTLDWLKEIRKYILINDELSLQRIDDRILELRAWFDDTSVLIAKIKSIFQKELEAGE